MCGSLDNCGPPAWAQTPSKASPRHQFMPRTLDRTRLGSGGLRIIRSSHAPLKSSSSTTAAGRFKAEAEASKQAAIDIMGRTTRASLKGKQAAEEDSTFDYNVSAWARCVWETGRWPRLDRSIDGACDRRDRGVQRQPGMMGRTPPLTATRLDAPRIVSIV